MSIDLSSETPLSLSEAAASCPGRPNITTIWRWCLRGCRGVRLESFVRGGRRFTTAEALERFIAGTTAAADSRNSWPATPSPVPTRTRRKEIAEAERFCESAGI